MAADHLSQTVCCLCGDVGFSTHLFRCLHCHHRFQHSYCSNYYGESTGPVELCDWCRFDQTQKPVQATNSAAGDSKGRRRPKNSGENPTPDVKNNGAPSPRSTTRRYKLLKDVMC